MLRHLSLVPLLFLAPFLHPASIAPEASGIRVDTITHGVKLTLIVPRRVYPWNAVAHITVRIQNISHTPFPLYGLDNPAVDVIGSKGRVVYPPAFTNMEFMLHADGGITQLGPGKSVQRSLYVILRGGEIRARMWAQEKGFNDYVEGGSAHVRLTTGSPSPHITLEGPLGVHAVVQSSEPHHGPLLYTRWGACTSVDGGEGGLEATNLSPSWHPTRSSLIWPPWSSSCSKITEWHAIAGWLDEPVTSVDYTGG